MADEQLTPGDESLSADDLTAVTSALDDYEGELDDDALGMVSGGLSLGEA